MRGMGAGNTLHLVLTNCEESIGQINLEPPIGKSDQATVITTIIKKKLRQEQLPSIFLYNKGDYVQIQKSQSSINWNNNF